MDLLFLPALFVVASAYFIGQAVGVSVPDEVKLWRKYFHSASDALVVLAMFFAAYALGAWWWGALAAIVFIIARYFLVDVYAIVNGILLAVAAITADAAVMVLVLTVCFLLGIGESKKKLWRMTLLHSVVALVVWAGWSLL